MSLTRTLTIVNAKGLHARASALFVETVERFDASATVCRDGQSVSGGSIMSLLFLAAAQGSEIEVSTRGPQAEELMQALEELLVTRFGEDK